MSCGEPAVLGRTGLKVGRLGIASGYKAPAAAIEEAFEQGCNYFTWGTVIKGDAPGMREALKAIVGKGQRDRLVLAAFTYAHNNFMTERMLRRGLRSAGRHNAAHRGAEIDIFPYLAEDTGKRPGTVAFTATRWGQLLKAKKMPAGEKPPPAADCYRFFLSHPGVDVCMSGARTVGERREN